MRSDPNADAPTPIALRSAITNGTHLLFGDGRSSGARRYRDLVAAFAAEVGGMSSLPASGQQTVRRLAQISLELECIEAQRAAGTPFDAVAYATLTNTQARLLRALRGLRSKASRPSLADHVATKYGGGSGS